MSVTVVLGRQGRLVVPAEIRAELDLREGEVLSLQRFGDTLVIQRPQAAAEQLRGLLTEQAVGRSLVEELIAERVAEASR